MWLRKQTKMPQWYLRRMLRTLLSLCVCCGCAVLESTVGVQSPAVIRAQSPARMHQMLPPASVPAVSNAESGAVYYPLTLREAVEQSMADSAQVRILSGRVSLDASAIYDSLIAEQSVASAEGKFQPTLSGKLEGTRVNQPPSAFFGPGIAANNRRDVADANLRLQKPLTTGGTVTVGVEPPTAYLYFPEGVNPGVFNPIYSNDLVMRITQPLWRGGGHDIATAPVRIAQTQLNQSRWDVQQQLNSQIRSVTQAYWQLYASYMELQAVRAVIPLAEESVRIEKLRFEAERTIYSDLARANVQLNRFRNTESTVSVQVRQRVLQLRQLMGKEPELEPMFLPADVPARQPPPSDVVQLIETASLENPKINQQRERIQERLTDLQVASNRVYPAINMNGEYRSSGITDRLDSSFRQALSRDYETWTVGVGLDVAIGNQTARSQKRTAELEVAREQIRTTATEQEVAFNIAAIVARLNGLWEQVQLSEQRARETQEWMRISRVRYAQPPASSTGRDLLLLELADFQSSMREYVDSVSDVGSAISQYNSALAELDEAQGTSLRRWRFELDNAQEPLECLQTTGPSSGIPGHQSYRTSAGIRQSSVIGDLNAVSQLPAGGHTGPPSSPVDFSPSLSPASPQSTDPYVPGYQQSVVGHSFGEPGR